MTSLIRSTSAGGGVSDPPIFQLTACLLPMSKTFEQCECALLLLVRLHLTGKSSR